MRGPVKPPAATAGSCSSATGLSGRPLLPGCTLRSSTTSWLLLLLLLGVLVGVWPAVGVPGRCHHAFLLLLLECDRLLKAARREGRPTEATPWSLRVCGAQADTWQCNRWQQQSSHGRVRGSQCVRLCCVCVWGGFMTNAAC
jgi:hypothetical protein